MTIAFQYNLITSSAGGGTGSASITVPPNTKVMYFFIYCDASNTAANNTDPSIVSWNGINATQVLKVANDASGTGQCQFLYKIDNPPAATATASVSHPTQFHHHGVVCVTGSTVITPAYSVNTAYGTGTACTVSVPSAVGNKTLFSIVADNANVADITIAGASTLLGSDGSSSRHAFKISSNTSAATTVSETWSLAASHRWSAFAIDLYEGLVQIDNLNGSTTLPNITPPSNAASTTGLSAITSVTLNDGRFNSISSAVTMVNGKVAFSFNFPYADGSIQAAFGPVTATLMDNARSSAIPAKYSLPKGYSAVTFADALNYSSGHLGSAFTLPDGMVMYYPSVYGFICSPKGTLTVDVMPVSIPVMFHNLQAGGDGSIVTKTINISASGAVTAVALKLPFNANRAKYATDGVDYPDVVINGSNFGSPPNIVLYRDWALDAPGPMSLTNNQIGSDFVLDAGVLPTVFSAYGRNGVGHREGGVIAASSNRRTSFIAMLPAKKNFRVGMDLATPVGRTFSGMSALNTVATESVLKTVWLFDGAPDDNTKADVVVASWTSANWAFVGNQCPYNLNAGSSYDFAGWNYFQASQVAGADPFVNNGTMQVVKSNSLTNTTTVTSTSTPAFGNGATAAQYDRVVINAWSGNGVSHDLSMHLISYIYIAMADDNNVDQRIELMDNAVYANAKKTRLIPYKSWTNNQVVFPRLKHLIAQGFTHYRLTAGANSIIGAL